jgi:polysaccharide pyruvyl transferase WcaK-like protein
VTAGRRSRPAGPPRVGLFGLLGSGNIGNDASMEAVLAYLRADHPDAVLDAMCTGPERLRTTYGVDAVPLFWQHQHQHHAAVPAPVLKALGKGIDAIRTAAWVRRHDVVIVPGMGVLETTLPLKAMRDPYALFLLCVAGRVFGTRVALISVGANVIRQPVTRWLLRSAARLAYYRSYRDPGSRAAMATRGASGPPDPLYPDLVFGLPAPPGDPADPLTVGVGVMDFYGTNDDRARAEQIHGTYLENMQRFVLWLVDSGRRVRLLVGDTDGSDDRAVREILARVRAQRPGLEPGRLTAEPTATATELMRAMAPAATIVATRYHNVICALRLAKPTLSVSYAAKHDALMADMGLAEFCHPATAVDAGRLIEQFTELESQAAQLRPVIAERGSAYTRQLAEQFAALSALLFPARPSAPAAEVLSGSER